VLPETPRPEGQRRMRAALCYPAELAYGLFADLLEQRPDWLVVRPSLMTGGAAFAGRHAPLRNIAELDSLRARYRVTHTVEGADGGEGLLVLRRER